MPAQLTPFTAVAFLRRIQQHHATRLGAGERAALDQQIAELEAGYFSAGLTPDARPRRRGRQMAAGGELTVQLARAKRLGSPS